MKPTLFILPVVSLVLVVSWLSREHRTGDILKKKSAVLRASLAARSSGSEVDAASSSTKSPHPVAKEERPFAWNKLSVEITEMEKAGDIQGIFRL